MSNPRPRSAGFIVVDIKTRAILSDIFPRRDPAREIAARLYSEGVQSGVHQVKLYPGETYSKDTYRP